MTVPDSKYGVKDFADAVLRRSPELMPCRVGPRAIRRLERAEKRQAAKTQETAKLLAHERRSGVTARGWRAAILARVLAGQVDTDE